MEVISRILNNDKIKEKVAQVAAERGVQSLPIVRTVQAIQTIFEVGTNVSKLITKATDAADTTHKLLPEVQRFIPEIQVLAQSLCDNAKIIGVFSTSATTIGIGINVVQTYQGVQALQLIAARLEGIQTQLAAQTALMAQKEFPQYVYDMIGERLNQTLDDPNCDHWFFLYHPDNDWYPKFYHLLEKRPLGKRFCGYTNQIDTIFLFMLAARKQIDKHNLRAQEKGKKWRHVRLHLLMPAYQPILIAEALRVPEEIGDFVMEGRINSNKPFVWLNLPEEQRGYTMDVGEWVPPNLGWWDWALQKLGVNEERHLLKEPRVIGTRQQQLEDCCTDGDDDNLEQEACETILAADQATEVGGDEKALTRLSIEPDPENEKARRNMATPIHHRRRIKKSKPKEKSNGNESSSSVTRERRSKKSSRIF